MALFNKLFSSRKNNTGKQENANIESPFTFTEEQVRVVLFRECDFRGRKLLFDSTSVKKILIDDNETSFKSSCVSSTTNETFAEISDGFGYLYTKPKSDFGQLAEMIFGLVAMSFRGTYFKIHKLENPQRLMLTQVFPSPRHLPRGRASTSDQNRTSRQSSEHSMKLDDSGGSSINSVSDHLSVNSTASDTLLVYMRNRSASLDVPHKGGSNPCVLGDSGICRETLYGSFSSSHQSCSVPTWESLLPNSSASVISFSSSSLYKKWLRGTSTSLDMSATSSNVFENEYIHKHRSSKLGLTFIIELTEHQAEIQTQFLMEHVALLESMVWRARQVVETAYLRPNKFMSLLSEVCKTSSKSLVNLMCGPNLPLNLWISLSNAKGCDNNSIKTFTNNNINKSFDIYHSMTFDNSPFRSTDNVSDTNVLTKSYNMLSSNQSEFSFFNITRLFSKSDKDSLDNKKTCIAEKFVEEFCGLLETVDVKDTNFFISTLVTAVLTHHLGWVATVFPSVDEVDSFTKYENSYNPLWDQLSDLYGAIAYPLKMSQTIVTGTGKSEVISKILNSLTYFIRSCDIDRSHLTRKDILEDNKNADFICQKNSCIPKTNYKKYEDHLREMMVDTNKSASKEERDEREIESIEMKNLSKAAIKGINLERESADMPRSCKPKNELSRVPKSSFNLADLSKISELQETSNENVFPQIYPKESVLYSGTDIHKQVHSSNIRQLKTSPKCYFSKSGLYSMERTNKLLTDTSVSTSNSNENNNVIFVLGDDEQLVGIKKGIENEIENDEANNLKTEKSIDRRETNGFAGSDKFEREFATSNFKDGQFIKTSNKSLMKSSLSWASLQEAESEMIKDRDQSELSSPSCEKCFNRSQSEPPEDREKSIKEEVKAKYKYCGIKFSMHQYPEIVNNYMRSKNLEMVNLTFDDKAPKFNQISFENGEVNLDFSHWDTDTDPMEAFQTPSNASELEFTSDLTQEASAHRSAKESSPDIPQTSNIQNHIPNTTKDANVDKIYKLRRKSRCNSTMKIDEEFDSSPVIQESKLKIIQFPMPQSRISSLPPKPSSTFYSSSLMKGLGNNYIPDMVLQGSTNPKVEWEHRLKADLALASQHSLLDQHVEEAVAIIADTDNWEVQLVSSHTYVIDKDTSGIRVGMSQLVAAMLESLLSMWKLHVPPQYCLMHIEQRLQELCLRSKALAQLLMATEFCSMELLTSTLHLEVNDVPLLLAVASTHSPQVTQKYGISFQ